MPYMPYMPYKIPILYYDNISISKRQKCLLPGLINHLTVNNGV